MQNDLKPCVDRQGEAGQSLRNFLRVGVAAPTMITRQPEAPLRMNDLHSLVYVSSATRPLSTPELEAILAVARRNNRAAGVTGMLLHCNGNFMQVLEGPLGALEETFQRICRSAAHHEIIELVREPVAAREFSDWSMAFSPVGAQEFLALTNASWAAPAADGSGPPASPGRELLSQFWGNGR